MIEYDIEAFGQRPDIMILQKPPFFLIWLDWRGCDKYQTILSTQSDMFQFLKNNFEIWLFDYDYSKIMIMITWIITPSSNGKVCF